MPFEVAAATFSDVSMGLVQTRSRYIEAPCTCVDRLPSARYRRALEPSRLLSTDLPTSQKAVWGQLPVTPLFDRDLSCYDKSVFQKLLLGPIIGILILSVAALPCSLPPPTIWQKNPRSSSALFRVVINNQAGYIDESGHLVIPPQFSPAYGQPAQGDFVEGVALVFDSGQHSVFIDEHGKKLDFHDLVLREGFSDSLTIAMGLESGRLSSKFLLVNHAGQVVASVDQYFVDRFSEGLAAFMEKKGWGTGPLKSHRVFGHRRGYIDKSGKIVIPARFAYAAPFSEGLAAVAADGPCWVAPYRFPAPSAAVQLTSCGPAAADSIIEPCQHGYIDKTGRLRIPERYELAQDFSEQRAGVRRRGKWGFIDRVGNEITEFRFDEVKSFSNDRAAVRVGSKWGYIDHSGIEVINAQYDDASAFSNGLAAVKKGQYYSFINPFGTEVIHGPYFHATRFVKGLAHLQIGETRWGWIDPIGKTVFTYDWKQ